MKGDNHKKKKAPESTNFTFYRANMGSNEFDFGFTTKCDIVLPRPKYIGRQCDINVIQL
jgi:hypothetical protein